MTLAADSSQWFEQIIEAQQANLNDDKLDWLEQARIQAAEQVKLLGKPTRKQEAWRYTNVDGLLKQKFAAANKPVKPEKSDIDELALFSENSYRLVFINGVIANSLSSISGLDKSVFIGSLAQGLVLQPQKLERVFNTIRYKGHVFSELNTASSYDGLYLHVPAGIKVDKPVEVIHLSKHDGKPNISQPRNLIVLEKNAELTLIEQYIGQTDSEYFNNIVTEVDLADGAKMTHAYLQTEAKKAFHICQMNVCQAAGSQYHGTNIALGGGWARADINVSLKGRQANCELNGLYTCADKQLSDFHLNVEHLVPECVSEEHFKGILLGKGRAVFDGRILVEKDAQQTSANLSNANLLLSRNAEVDTKPQLEIYADDVKCSHGTTVGQLDNNHVFYLRSRGINEIEARKILSLGFANEVIAACPLEQLKSWLETGIAKRLAEVPANLGNS